jgi:hypothetical protein
MATARHLNLQTAEIHDKDCWSQRVMVYAGETFNWTIKQNQANSVNITPVSSWPLNAASYTVTPATPQNATVSSTATPGTSWNFNTDPSSGNTPQVLLVAIGVFQSCNGIPSPGVAPGQCYAWQNNTDKNIVVKGTGTWPPAQVVKKDGGIVFGYVPDDGSVPSGSYPISVTEETGGSNACPQDTNPVIIVSGPTEPGPCS